MKDPKRTASVDRPFLFVANRGYALTSSRRSLIESLVRDGREVVIATADDPESRQLADLGARLEPVRFDRGGFAMYHDIIAFRRLLEIHRRRRPLLVQQFHAKPVIYGTLAASRVQGSGTRVVNTITGLGHAFIAGGATARFAAIGYRHALARGSRTVFQNRDDFDLFVERRWVPREQAVVIAGSGVDLDRFRVVDRGNRGAAPPTVVLLARLLWQKGIQEFVEVARRITRRWPEARFVVAGEEDPVHPDAVPADWLREADGVEYVGRLQDVRALLASADLMLFPSYREGVPRVVLEGAATGLPTVAFDVPGVREAVTHERSGLLAPLHDIVALSDHVARLLGDSRLRLELGRAARRDVEARFDIRRIQQQYLELYARLVTEAPG